jgi:Ca-activated chloride channel family protein
MKSRKASSPVLIFAGVVFALMLVCCCVLWQIGSQPTTQTSTATLNLAYSPEKEALITDLVARFNSQNLRTPDGQRMQVNATKLDPEAMIDAALAGSVQAITPDSSIWLDQLDQAWRAKTSSDSTLVGQTIRYAVSPVVLAMWEDVAKSLGYPDQPIGWGDILTKAKSDPNFRWSHPSTNSASGLLATLAEFYAGAGKTRGLTENDVKAQSTLDYVAAIEKTVRYYGEGELAVIDRAKKEGRSFLDAFVVSEQLVITFNRGVSAGSARLVAVYPKEGTAWADHPLALLEQPDLTSNQRLTFGRFHDFLTSRDSQMKVLATGYRPADLNISLSDPTSPITQANGVDPVQPQTALQVPGSAVVQVVKDVWYYTKRKTNVFLVVDTSGSMEGEKLTNVKDALKIFLGQIKGDQERVGMVEFSSSVYDVVELDAMANNRTTLTSTVEGLSAGGNTALLDAIAAAYDRLQALGDKERINAIVAMTDGKENNSTIGLDALTRKLRDGNQRGVPVVIFCIAYGSDADLGTLQRISDATGGQTKKGDLETIRQLYKILSTYF